jgi:hypothetical protein
VREATVLFVAISSHFPFMRARSITVLVSVVSANDGCEAARRAFAAFRLARASFDFRADSSAHALFDAFVSVSAHPGLNW